MRPQLEAALVWATPGQRGFTDNLRNQMAYSTTFDTPNFSQTGGAAAAAGMGMGMGGMGMGMGAAMGGMAGMAGGMASAMAGALGMGAGSMPIPLPIPTSSQMPKGYNPEAAHAAMQAQMEARARAAELAAMLNTLEKVDDAGRRDSALDSICINENVLVCPVIYSDESVT
jgi:SWI/SNF-related matrix-associated actin-dependent regulator of chromatin subfamily A3